MRRVEDAAFLTGRARFLDDLALPGMAHAAFVRSPLAHARVLSVDTSTARALPGVLAVVTGADLDGWAQVATTIPTRTEPKLAHRSLLATGKVRHVGDPVAVVVATSRALAEDACELIEVEWEPLEAVVDPEAALAADAPRIHDELDDNNFAHIEYEEGDVEAAFAAADRVFAKSFHFGRCHAAPLETRGVIADWGPGGDVTLWTSTQFPFLVRWLVAGQLGLRETALRVITPSVGGAFGLKVHVFVEEILMPILSQTVGRPVKWVEDRYENLAASGHAKEVVCHLEAAVKEDGTFLAFRGRYIGDSGAYQAHPWTCLIDPLCAASGLPAFYRLQAVRYEVDAPFTNKCQSTAYRAVGWTPGQAARESLVDDIARGLGIDPVELRIANAMPDGEPFRSLTGAEYDGGSFTQSMRTAVDAIDYDALREEQARLREQGRYLGIGFSPFVEQGGWASGIARANGFPDYNYTDAVTVTMDTGGSVTVATGLQSTGMSHETTIAQLTADALGVPFESIRVVQGDTSATAYATGSYGSRTAVVSSGAVALAAGDVRRRLLEVAGAVLEASAEDLDIVEGRISVRGSPDRGLDVGAAAAAAYWGPRVPGVDQILTSTRSYAAPETWSNACIVAVVEVDAETGMVDIRRLVVVEDCGTVINPTIVEGQVHGAVAQGIGAALYEGLPYADDGQFLAGSLTQFLYPTATEVPDVEVIHLATPSPLTEGGVKGMGEGGLIGAPSAIVNAVADALAPFGAVVTRTPLLPEDVLALIDAGG